MPKLPDHVRRALRTLYQAVAAMITLVPMVLAVLPAGSPAAVRFGAVAAAVAAMSGIINKAEDAGLIPAWLKADPAVGDDAKDAPAAPAA